MEYKMFTDVSCDVHRFLEQLESGLVAQFDATNFLLYAICRNYVTLFGYIFCNRLSLWDCYVGTSGITTESEQLNRVLSNWLGPCKVFTTRVFICYSEDVQKQGQIIRSVILIDLIDILKNDENWKTIDALKTLSFCI